MGMLDELLAGGQLQKEYRDFVKRYEQGDPSQGYSDQEVLTRYGEVSHAVPPDQYAQAAQEALSKLSPQERAAFVKMLQDRAGDARRDAAATGGARTEGTGQSAHRSACEAGAAPGYSRRRSRPASAASVRVKHPDIPAG